MFRVNLINKPGHQDDRTIDESILSDQSIKDSNENQLITKKNLSSVKRTTKFKEPRRIDLFSIIIIILIIGIIISVLTGYYLKYL